MRFCGRNESPNLGGAPIAITEVRALERYRNHAQREGVDDKTLEVLKAVSADEKWHLAWVNAKMYEIAVSDAATKDVQFAPWTSWASSSARFMRPSFPKRRS
jgi:hypothetical protein